MPPHLQSMASPPLSSHNRQAHSGRLPPRGDSKTPPRPNTSSRNSHHLHHQSDLRVAYKAQSKSTGPVVGGQNINHHAQHHHQLHTSHSDDQRSLSSVSATHSGAPSSVYMPSVPLTRDVSDLSGLSGGTSRGSKAGSVPGQVFDPRSLKGPWRQAYNLSNVPPEVSQSDSHSRNGDGRSIGDSISDQNDRRSGLRLASQQPSIWVPQNDVVEIFQNLQSSLGLDRFQMHGHNRIPVMILLMDPNRQTYELMQIWVDRSIDSIRDLVHALQHKLPDKWKQAYDGIFQVRGHRFTQLINIIRLVKYDIQPHEILVAKPWSMTAKVTIAFAGSVIRHLTTIGVISKYEEPEEGDTFSMERVLRPKPEEAPLILSKKAQDRAYFPEGILNHHHAVQFITFSPPFELASGLHDDIHNLHQRASPTNSQPSQLGSHPLSTSVDSEYSNSNPLASRAVSSLLVNGNNPTTTADGLSLSPKSVTNPPMVDPSDGIGRQIVKSGHRAHSYSQGVEIDLSNGRCKYTESSFPREDVLSGGGVRGLLSKLNCCKDKETSMLADHQLYHGMNRFPGNSLMALSEEEEQQWLAYSMLPIAEDQSLAGGRSIVSMSAPLLPSAQASHPSKQHQHGHRSATTATQPQQGQRPQVPSSSGIGYDFGRMAGEF